MSRAHGLLAVAVAYALLVLPAAAEKRVALVIGNSAYVHSGALSNPVNDAGDMGDALKQVGFEVILGLDVDKRAFDTKVRDFARALEQADVAVFFYAGHGLQVSGRNYLIPVDARLQGERDLDFEAVAVDFVMRQMELERRARPTWSSSMPAATIHCRAISPAPWARARPASAKAWRRCRRA